MMPPWCAVCGARPGSDAEYRQFRLVYFRETGPPQTDIDEDGWAGHPDNAVWFCAPHLPSAEALRHLPAGEALARLR
ncbi:hypothetical protein ITI46_08305 [Streptomyces oryzae]|uniref:NUDIX hydrolase n=1 Tax=Streptomyces oryzae TaxID=1434886 RepID=A0ABS3X8H4_9ACTN|nr:hypothetical protein [Streptomyces oryzae]MBO8191682.1 hypothetical protein [Streptomyces oryzae]